MAGIKGAKQKKCLTETEYQFLLEKLLKIKNGNQIKFCLTKNDLNDFVSAFGFSAKSLQKRWKISQDFSKKIFFCYPWEDRFDDSLPIKCHLLYVCEFCNNQSILLRKKFLDRKIKLFKSCGRCHAKNVCALPEQKIINSKAQKIAQNKPETLEKMSIASKKAWERDYENRCNSIQKSYDENPFHRQNVRLASIKNWSSEEYRKKTEKSNAYCWGYYSDIFYQSLCELAFIIWCEEKSIKIKRYDDDPINYVDEINIKRNYIPDFIIDLQTIVEVKSSLDRENYLGRLKKILLKSEAASEFCKLKGFGYRIVEVKKDLHSSYYRKARKIHYGKAQEKNVLSLHGEGP